MAQLCQEIHTTLQNAPVNILIVSEPGIDGVFRHVQGLCRYLFTRGATVHLAYSSVRGSDALRELVASVHSHGGRTLDMKIANRPCVGDLKAFTELRRLAREVRADVVHSHSSKAGVLGRGLALSGIKARYLYTPNAYYGMSGRHNLMTGFFNLIETLLGRLGETINVSDDESSFATDTLRIARSRIHVIQNPVNASEFRPGVGSEKAAIRARYGIPEGALVLGSVGRLCFQKDPQTMYKALAGAMDSRRDLWFCHVGRGELEAEVNALADSLGIAAKIVRIEYLESPAEVYRAFDAFFLTSRYEGAPIVVLEALASGLPVIVSACRGLSHITQGGLSHCWSAEPGDAKAFDNAIGSWIRDIQNRRPVNHRQIAEQRFSTEVLYGEVFQLYQGIRGADEVLRHNGPV